MLGAESITNILVIAAHPDDEVLGCGGTILATAPEDVVIIGILGEGITSRYPKRDEAPIEELNSLELQAKQVSSLLGASDLVLGGLPDNRFDSLDMLDIVQTIEQWIDKFNPGVVYTHHPGDLNIDHSTTYRSVLTATRPTKGSGVKELYTFEVPSSTEWAFQSLSPPFMPNTFVDVSDVIDRKVQALNVYKDEVRDFPHPRSSEGLKVVARRWGSVIGTNYAEAFQLIRSIRRDN